VVRPRAARAASVEALQQLEPAQVAPAASEAQLGLPRSPVVEESGPVAMESAAAPALVSEKEQQAVAAPAMSDPSPFLSAQAVEVSMVLVFLDLVKPAAAQECWAAQCRVVRLHSAVEASPLRGAERVRGQAPREAARPAWGLVRPAREQSPMASEHRRACPEVLLADAGQTRS
jgi:hypothetical protein